MDLAQLSSLARDQSSASRSALALALTDLFLKSPNMQAEKVAALYGDIVCKVIDKIEAQDRQTLAGKVCEHAKAPRELVRVLASDEIDIAETVLRQALVLTNEDLIEIAKTQSQDHLRAIASRARLDQAVCHVVIRRADADVLVTIAKNRGASISGESFKQLATQARDNLELQEALCDRGDLTRQAADILAPFLNQELEKRVLKQRKNETIVKALTDRPLHKVNVQLHDFGNAPSKSQMMIDDIVARKVPIDEGVNFFASRNKTLDISKLIASVVGMPEGAMMKIFFREEDQLLIQVCKIAGVSDKAYAKIVDMRAKRLKMTAAAIADAVDRYSRMTLEEAQAAMANGKGRPKK